MARTRTAKRMTRKILRSIFVLFVALVNGILLFRVFTAGDPASMKTLGVDADTVAAYERALAEGRELEVYYQYYDEMAAPVTGTERHVYFTLTRTRFLPDAEQVQIVLRYNNAMLENLAADYDLPAIPARDEQVFRIALAVHYADGREVLCREADEVRSETKLNYNYRQCFFNDLTIDESVGEVRVLIFYGTDSDTEEAAYCSFLIYDKESHNLAYELTRQDERALKSAR